MVNQRLYKKAVELRKKGYSYSEISNELHISGGTLSYWFCDKQWSREIQEKNITKWKIINRKRLLKINQTRKADTVVRHNAYKQEARKEYSILNKDPLFRVGLSIYWGEGEKCHQGRVAVVNTDPDLIKVTIHFFRSCLKITENRFRVALFAYKDHSIPELLDFWSEELKIPKNQFIKTQILKSRSNLAKRKVSKGICNIYFSDTKFNTKILEWIRLLALEMRE